MQKLIISLLCIIARPLVRLLNIIKLIDDEKYKHFNRKCYHFKVVTIVGWHNFCSQRRVKRYFNLHNPKAKMVIYTCLTGGYDALIIPTFINPECDYVCFTDDQSMLARHQIGPWLIKPLLFDTGNNAKNNRWHKMHPHLLFADYPLSLYIDGNVDFCTGKVFEYIRNISPKYYIATPRHNARDCIYEEGEFVVQRNIDSAEKVFPLLDKYHQEGFPEHFGMGENNVIFRRHHNPRCIKLMNSWWEIFNLYSKRDQLSLFYLFWQQKADWTFMSPLSFKKDHKNFRIYKHKG